MLEVAARISFSLPGLVTPHDRSAAAVWRAAWVDRQQRVDIYYSFDVYHPTRGWALAPGLRGLDDFGPDSVSSSSMGLRGSREHPARPAPGVSRLLLLGDSFTFGDEVADRETWASRLQELLPGSEVLNFGVHGYGHDQMLLYFTEEGFRFHPDVVVLGFVRDDMYRNLLEFRDYAKPRMELSEGGLRVRHLPVPSPSATLRWHRLGPRLLDLLEVAWVETGWRSGVRQREMTELTAAILDRLTEEAARAGAVTVLVYLPHSEELVDAELEVPEQAFFASYCHSRATFCLDLRPRFLERIASGQRIKTPGHWDAAGHELVAEDVAAYLVARGLCGPRT